MGMEKKKIMFSSMLTPLERKNKIMSAWTLRCTLYLTLDLHWTTEEGIFFFVFLSLLFGPTRTARNKDNNTPTNAPLFWKQ